MLEPPTTVEYVKALSPVLCVAGGGILVLAADIAMRRKGARVLMEGICYVALVAALFLTAQRLGAKPGWYFLPDGKATGAVAEDLLARMIGMAVLSAAVLMVLLSPRAIERAKMRAAEFLALVLFASAGMMLLAMSADLISLFITIELMSLSIYVLAGMARTDLRANEAAMKYFVNGSFASAFLLFGMALVYGATGTVFLGEMSAKIADNQVLAMLGLTLMLVGFGFKVGAVPFHFWVPDVYEGAPTAVTAFMSVAVKAAGFAALLRFVLVAFPDDPAVWTDALTALAVLTMVVGNVMAVRQKSVKRMLAYSSVAHSGYLLVGVVAGSVDATIFYLFVYTFMTFGAFAFVTLIARGGKDAEDVGQYAGLGRLRPWSAAAMTLFMISLSGIPPTAGFFGKFALFGAAMNAKLYGLVVVGVLMSAVSVYYYMRVVVFMYMKEPEAGAAELEPADQGTSMAVGIACIFVLLLGIFPSTILSRAEQAAKLLLQ
ncbi:MAG: NADH-quinone oxidoreductase subunit N [Planctomycetota bacterium]|jgi:NADH-quinone oxidoreductase subunit N